MARNRYNPYATAGLRAAQCPASGDSVAGVRVGATIDCPECGATTRTYRPDRPERGAVAIAYHNELGQ